MIPEFKLTGKDQEIHWIFLLSHDTCMGEEAWHVTITLLTKES